MRRRLCPRVVKDNKVHIATVNENLNADIRLLHAERNDKKIKKQLPCTHSAALAIRMEAVNFSV